MIKKNDLLLLILQKWGISAKFEQWYFSNQLHQIKNVTKPIRCIF